MKASVAYFPDCVKWYELYDYLCLMKQWQRNIGLGILILVVGIISCKKERSANWDADYLIPVSRSVISVQNIFGDYTTSGSNTLDFTYRKEIYNNSLGLVNVPDTGLSTTFTLDKLALSDRTITRYITLGEINPLFLLLDGSSTSIDAQSQSNLSPIDIDANEFFETALIASGEMVFEFKNELPVNVKKLDFDIVNKSDGSIVGNAVFNNVAPNMSDSKIIDLSGKRVNGELQAKIKSMETDASNGPVLINASKGLSITISVRNIKTKEAIAAFPNQTILEQDEPLSQYFDGAELKYMKVRTGKLKIKLFTSVKENMTLYLKIPSATKGGKIIDEKIEVKGGTIGNPTIVNREIDMTGYTIDYRGKNPNVTDTVNTFYQVMRVTLDSSGRKVSISLQDSINISYVLESLVPEYAIGFLGERITESGNVVSDLDIFSKMSGKIDFSTIKMRLDISNGIGAEGSILTKYLTGINSISKKEVSLAANIIGNPYAIDRATLSPFIPKQQTIFLNQGNSNVKAFIENLPDKVNLNMDLKISPNGNNNNWHDFVYYDSRLSVNIAIDFPAILAFENLQFKDSVPFQFSSLAHKEQIKEGKLNIFFENTFPFSMNFKLALHDENGNFLDTIGNDVVNLILPAVGGQLAKGKTIMLIPANKMEALQRSKYAIVLYTVNTPENKHVSITSSDYCKLDMSANVKYQVQNPK